MSDFRQEWNGFRQELNDTNVLCVASEGDFPPFSYSSHGLTSEDVSTVGIEISLFSEICKRLGIQYRPVRTSWANILQGLESNAERAKHFEFDCSSASMDITEERQNGFFMTRPYYKSSCVLVTLESSSLKPSQLAPPERCWHDVLVGCRIVTIETSTFADALRALGATVLTTAVIGSAWLDMLRDGSADGFASEAAHAEAVAAAARSDGDVALRIHAPPLRVAAKGFAVPHRSPRLFSAVDAALASILAEDGLIDALVRDGVASAAAAAKDSHTLALT